MSGIELGLFALYIKEENSELKAENLFNALLQCPMMKFDEINPKVFDLMSAEIISKIFDILINTESCSYSYMALLFLINQYQCIDRRSRIVQKLLDIFKKLSQSLILDIVYFISVNHKPLFHHLLECELLAEICHGNDDMNNEKVLLFVVQSLQEISLKEIMIIKRYSDRIESVNNMNPYEYFLRILSATSVVAQFDQAVLTSPHFWNAIIINLMSNVSINRKRSLYWLNKAFYLCKSSLEQLEIDLSSEIMKLSLSNSVLTDILHLVESLEEKQTHVILPILSRFGNIKQCYLSDMISIHWLLIIVSRALAHESTVIVKWGFSEFLSLPIVLEFPSYLSMMMNFFVGTLNNSVLYYSIGSVTSNSGFFASDPLANFLHRLFTKFCEPRYECTLNSFLDHISVESWNSQGFLFFAEAFSKVKLAGVEFSIDILRKLAVLFRRNLSTLDAKYRQAVGSFLMMGFISNHLVCFSFILDYVAGFDVFVNNRKAIFTDTVLINFLLEKFSASENDCSTAFTILENLVLDKEYHCLTSSKLFTVSFFMVLLSGSVPQEMIKDLMTKLSLGIADVAFNPYVNEELVFRNILLIKNLHSVSSQLVLHHPQQLLIESTAKPAIKQLISFLLRKIKQDYPASSQTQMDYLKLLKYFVTRFSDMIDVVDDKILCILYCSYLSLDVGCCRNAMGKLILSDFIDRGNPTKISPVVYQRLRCLSRNISQFVNGFSMDILLEHCNAVLEVTMIPFGIISVFRLAEAVMDKLSDAESEICRFVEVAWTKICDELANAQQFWKMYSAFLLHLLIPLMNLAIKLKDASASGDLFLCLNRIVNAIFELGEKKMRLVNLFGQHFLAFVRLSSRLFVTGQMEEFCLSTACRLALFGPFHRRNDKYGHIIDQYFSSVYRNRWQSAGLTDSSSRVSGILVFCLDSVVDSQRLLEQAVFRLNEAEQCFVAASSGCYKNYINNQTHRTRHRLFSLLLVIISNSAGHLSSDVTELVERWMIAVLRTETLASIRRLAEWILMTMTTENCHLLDRLIALLAGASDGRPAFVCSLITVLKHVLDTIVDKQEQASCALRLVMIVLPMAAAQNHNVRIHSMAFICAAEPLLDTTNEALRTVVRGHIAFLDRSSTAKNVRRLTSNFWWASLDVAGDVCLETLFETLPRLMGLVEEELIPTYQFRMAAGSESCYKVMFESGRHQWVDCSSSELSWRVRVEASDEVDSGDHQKKVQPWVTTRPDEDELREAFGMSGTVFSDCLILCCSLVDKPTNVGGLARTCNVFGVGEFVVGNMAVVENVSFRQLAVTADKWITMTEVLPSSLVEFIGLKRQQGWEIVGIEQTANSEPLQSVTFRERTMLVLGNEKEGIPVNVLAHVDRCVEVPQVGQIRSLNVHVTGAIVIWEYAKQMRFARK